MSIIDGMYWDKRYAEEEKVIKGREDYKIIRDKALTNSLCRFCKNDKLCRFKEDCEKLHIELYRRVVSLEQPFTVTVKCKYYEQINIEPPVTEQDIIEFEKSIGVDYSIDE